MGLAVFVCCVAVEHLLESSLDPLSHQVSEYVHTSSGGVMTLGFLAWTVSLAATAACARKRWHSVLLTALLIAAAGGMALSAAFATQTVAGELPANESLSTAGTLHDLGSGLTALTLLCSALVSTGMRKAPRWFRHLTPVLVLLALTITAVLLGVGPEVGGLRQRLVLATGCLWQLFLLKALSDSRPLDR